MLGPVDHTGDAEAGRQEPCKRTCLHRPGSESYIQLPYPILFSPVSCPASLPPFKQLSCPPTRLRLPGEPGPQATPASQALLCSLVRRLGEWQGSGSCH